MSRAPNDGPISQRDVTVLFAVTLQASSFKYHHQQRRDFPERLLLKSLCHKISLRETWGTSSGVLGHHRVKNKPRPIHSFSPSPSVCTCKVSRERTGLRPSVEPEALCQTQTAAKMKVPKPPNRRGASCAVCRHLISTGRSRCFASHIILLSNTPLNLISGRAPVLPRRRNRISFFFLIFFSNKKIKKTPLVGPLNPIECL